MLKKRVPIRNVRDIAAAFSGDIELFTEFLVSLKERNDVSVFRGVRRRNHARRPAADHENDHVRSSLTASER